MGDEARKTARSQRVLFVSHSGELAGGAEFCLDELLRGLRDVAPEMQLDVVVPQRGRWCERLERKAAASVHVIPHFRWAHLPDVPRRARVRGGAVNVVGVGRIARLIRELRPSFVVSNTLTSPAGAFAAWCVRRPHVWLIHEYGVADHGLSFDLGYERSLRLIGKLSELVIVNSDAVRREVERPIGPAKIALARYAVDPHDGSFGPRTRKRGPDDTLKALLVGNIAASKGQHVAIAGVANARRCGADVTLTIVGAGGSSQIAALRDVAQRHDVVDAVSILPWSEEAGLHYRDHDVALMCSAREAFGRVTVEAMKSGLAVVGSNSGGTPEIISDRSTGLLFPPGDDRVLGDLLVTLSKDEELRDRLASAGQRWASETFTLASYARRFVDLTEHLACAT